ncbi:MAG: hypothetical protein ACYC99_04330 [Candidatus Geothermincolia bacterium]
MSLSAETRCPKCGSRKLARVVYGYPRRPLRLYARTGRVVLAGCMVGSDSPTLCCRRCGTRFDGMSITAEQ